MPKLTFTPDAAIAAAREKSGDQARSLEAAIRAELLDHVLGGTAVLEDFSSEEQKYLDYAVLCRLRGAAYVRIVEAMATPDALVEWAAAMAAKYGPVCRIHAHELPWLPALRVVRWGEEPAHWPATWEAADLQRAANWLAGDHPAFLTYLIGPDRTAITPRPGARFAIA
jgi:hypothetical protein